MAPDKIAIGDEVGVIAGISGNTINFFGYGIYICDEIPIPSAAGYLSVLARKSKAKVPKIKLESGKIVYGSEGWFGKRKKIEDFLAAAIKNGKTVKAIAPEKEAQVDIFPPAV